MAAGPRITHIAALGRNRVIGDGTGMPWHLPEDLRWFKAQTMGHPMIMGRRTFDSMGALPGRRSIILSRDPALAPAGEQVQVARSVDQALARAADGEGGEEVFVVGGGEIYRQTLDRADRLLLTEVDLAPAGSVTYPEFDEAVWPEVHRERRDGFAWVERQRASTG